MMADKAEGFYMFMGEPVTRRNDEPTAVTLMKDALDERLEKSRHSMDEAVGKASKLRRRLRKKGSYPKLKAALSERPAATPAAKAVVKKALEDIRDGAINREEAGRRLEDPHPDRSHRSGGFRRFHLSGRVPKD